MNPEKWVTLPKKRYQELCAAERKLDALETMGVDNWEGYDIAMSEYLEEEE